MMLKSVPKHEYKVNKIYEISVISALGTGIIRTPPTSNISALHQQLTGFSF